MKEIKVVGKRTNETTDACCSLTANAEVTLEVTENDKTETLFVHVASIAEGIVYTLSKESYYDFITGATDEEPESVEYIEYYDPCDEAFEGDEEKQWDAVMESEYAEYFKLAKELLEK